MGHWKHTLWFVLYQTTDGILLSPQRPPWPGQELTHWRDWEDPSYRCENELKEYVSNSHHYEDMQKQQRFGLSWCLYQSLSMTSVSILHCQNGPWKERDWLEVKCQSRVKHILPPLPSSDYQSVLIQKACIDDTLLCRTINSLASPPIQCVFNTLSEICNIMMFALCVQGISSSFCILVESQQVVWCVSNKWSQHQLNTVTQSPCSIKIDMLSAI